jgi:hypothetical protein
LFLEPSLVGLPEYFRFHTAQLITKGFFSFWDSLHLSEEVVHPNNGFIPVVPELPEVWAKGKKFFPTNPLEAVQLAEPDGVEVNTIPYPSLREYT